MVRRQKLDQKSSVPAQIDGPAAFEERLRMLLDAFDSRQAAADVAGVSTQQLARYLRSGSVPPYDVVARLCSAKGFSLDWLAGTSDLPAKLLVAPPEHSVAVPRYDTRAGAGALQLAHGQEPTDFVHLGRDFLAQLQVKAENALQVVVDGPSMEDTIRHGESVLGDKSETEPRDDIFIGAMDEGIFIKRLQRRADGSIMLISDNPAYKPEILPRHETDNLRLICRVKFVFRRL